MLRGLYTAASAMIAQQRRHDTVTNNIANLNTPGYKAMNTVNRAFPEVLLAAMGGVNPPQGSIGGLTTGVFAEENLHNMAQGDLQQTYRPLDMAIVSDILIDGVVFDASGKALGADGNVTFKPQVFFAVRTADGGEQYTRDGSFRAAPDGTLLTAEGLPVLGVNGELLVTDVPWDRVMVSGTGVLMDSATGQPLAAGAQLRIVRIDNPNLLVRQGDGLFRYEGDPADVAPVGAGERYDVRQGYLERSNVDAAQSAVDLMAALRAYEANQKVIQAYDQTLNKTVNDVGRI